MVRIDGNSSQANYGFYIIIEEKSQNIIDNYTNVDYKLYLKNNGSNFATSSWHIHIEFDNVVIYDTSNVTIDTTDGGYTGITLIAVGNTNVIHNNNGTKVINVAASINKASGSYASYEPGYCSLNGNVTLTPIKRLAMFDSVPNEITDEQDITFSYIMPNLNYHVKPKLKFSNKYDENITISLDTYITSNPYTFSWRSPTNLNNVYVLTKISDINNIKIILETYNNDTLLGSVESSLIKFKIVDAEPVLNVTLEEQNTNVAQYLPSNQLLNNVSKIKATIVGTAQKQALMYNYDYLAYVTEDVPQIPPNTLSFSKDISVEDTAIFYIEPKISDHTKTKIWLEFHGVDTRNKKSDDYVTSYTLIDYLPVNINNYKLKRINPTSNQIQLDASFNYFDTNLGDTPNEVTISISDDGINYTVVPSTNYVLDNNNHIITITNYIIPFSLNYKQQKQYYIKIADLISEAKESGVDAYITKGIGTFELGDNEVQINGDLFLADENRQNIKNIKAIIPNVRNTLTTNDTDTYSCNYINNTNEYSTQEINTHKKWIDGRDIYRMVYQFTPTGQSSYYYLNIKNFDILISLNGSFIREDGFINLLPNSYINWEAWVYDFVKQNDDTERISIKFSNNQWNSHVGLCTLIIEYVKT